MQTCGVAPVATKHTRDLRCGKHDKTSDESGVITPSTAAFCRAGTTCQPLKFMQTLEPFASVDSRRGCSHDPGMYRRGKANRRFDFPPGRSVAGKYVIEHALGSGWEGEVYSIVERNT